MPQGFGARRRRRETPRSSLRSDSDMFLSLRTRFAGAFEFR